MKSKDDTFRAPQERHLSITDMNSWYGGQGRRRIMCVDRVRAPASLDPLGIETSPFD